VSVRYIDFGFTCARDFWQELVLPSYAQFEADPNRASAITASILAWQMHEWIRHEQRPVIRKDIFQKTLIAGCSELALIRDVADAGKHRGINRAADVQKVGPKRRIVGPYGTVTFGMGPPFGEVRVDTTPLLITLADGKNLGFSAVLSCVIAYWRANYFS
jgi:hypothetical protein